MLVYVPVYLYGSKSFCCIDKKGVLSWPNPTAEKVFILTDVNGGHSHSHRSAHASRRHGKRHSSVSATGDHHCSADGFAGHTLDTDEETTHTPAKHLHGGKGLCYK